MYFSRLSENFMSVCDKYFHFVFNITGNTSSEFLQKLQMSGEVFPFASRAFQGEVYSMRARASISTQSPSSLDPDGTAKMALTQGPSALRSRALRIIA